MVYNEQICTFKLLLCKRVAIVEMEEGWIERRRGGFIRGIMVRLIGVTSERKDHREPEASVPPSTDALVLRLPECASLG